MFTDPIRTKVKEVSISINFANLYIWSLWKSVKQQIFHQLHMHATHHFAFTSYNARHFFQPPDISSGIHNFHLPLHFWYNTNIIIHFWWKDMFFQVFWKASPDMCLFWGGYGSENILQELIVKVHLKYYSRATSVNKVHLCNWVNLSN